jgi:iron complex transport system ATP-binding protein
LARERVLATVQELTRGRETNSPTVLMITHHVEELLPKTANVLVLKDGRAAALGKPHEVLTSAVLSKVYEFPVRVTRRGGRHWVQVHPSAWEMLAKRRRLR